MSFSNIYVMNTWLLLSPSSLCCDWALGSLPLVTSLADPRNAWSLLLYAAILVLLAHLLFSRNNRHLMPAGMGVALLFLSFFPATGIVFRVGFVIAERYVLLKSCHSMQFPLKLPSRPSSQRPVPFHETHRTT
jgi:hypothetical protein